VIPEEFLRALRDIPIYVDEDDTWVSEKRVTVARSSAGSGVPPLGYKTSVIVNADVTISMSNAFFAAARRIGAHT